MDFLSMKRQRTSGYDLPRELEEQIIAKLPVKSLLRFRSVCKSWNSLITCSMFVNDHLHANIQKRDAFFSNSKTCSSVVGFSDSSLLYDFGLGQNGVRPLLTVGEVSRLRFIPGHGLRNIYDIQGHHCNGIVCLIDQPFGQEHKVALYNPALRQAEIIQNPPGCMLSGFGFGFDGKTNDYKFVGIVFYWAEAEYKAEVYSLRTGRRREVRFGMTSPLMLRSGGYVNGRFYWVNCIEKNLLSFDMSAETFGRVDLPRGQAEMRNRKWLVQKPSVMGRGAHSLAYVVSSDNDIWKMWVMNHGGEWAEHHEIGPLERPMSPAAFWKEDELLMEDEDGLIWSYSLRTKILTKVCNPGAVKSRIAFGTSYIETLVLVKPHT